MVEGESQLIVSWSMGQYSWWYYVGSGGDDHDVWFDLRETLAYAYARVY